MLLGHYDPSGRCRDPRCLANHLNYYVELPIAEVDGLAESEDN